MSAQVYRYDLNGCKLTTHDLVDAFCSAIGEGCPFLLLANVRGRDDVNYSFVLRPELISPGPIISLLEEASTGGWGGCTSCPGCPQCDSDCCSDCFYTADLVEGELDVRNSNFTCNCEGHTCTEEAST